MTPDVDFITLRVSPDELSAILNVLAEKRGLIPQVVLDYMDSKALNALPEFTPEHNARLERDRVLDGGDPTTPHSGAEYVTIQAAQSAEKKTRATTTRCWTPKESAELDFDLDYPDIAKTVVYLGQDPKLVRDKLQALYVQTYIVQRGI